jgi:uncharacterized protein (TIGR03083 family)
MTGNELEPATYLNHVRADATAFAAALSDPAVRERPVPSCPDWTGADLLWHLTEVYRWWTWIVVERRQSEDGYEPAERPAEGELDEAFQARCADLLAALSATPGDTAVWTWWADDGPSNVDAIIRRMAHETAMHRVDAQLTAGAVQPIDAALASDGIDELLSWFLPWLRSGVVAGSVHIHCGDIAGEWTIRPNDNDRFDVTREHAKGDCALRGAASDLLCALWRRGPVASIEVVGDAAVAQRFLGALQLD